MLHIVRGLPGSGKSTFAKTLGCFHVEADMYFIYNKVYTFEPARIRLAHEWCQSTVNTALMNNMDVVVSNTFVAYWEVEPYILMATPNYKIYRCTNQYNNIHGIPDEVFKRMKEKFDITSITNEILVS